MSATTLRPGVTLRLQAEAHERIRRIAEAEHRSISAYLEMLVERDLAARAEAERVVRVHVATELAGTDLPGITREAGETDAEYAARSATLRTLFGH
jgi:hypothetical protein